MINQKQDVTMKLSIQSGQHKQRWSLLSRNHESENVNMRVRSSSPFLLLRQSMDDRAQQQCDTGTAGPELTRRVHTVELDKEVSSISTLCPCLTSYLVSL